MFLIKPMKHALGASSIFTAGVVLYYYTFGRKTRSQFVLKRSQVLTGPHQAGSVCASHRPCSRIGAA